MATAAEKALRVWPGAPRDTVTVQARRGDGTITPTRAKALVKAGLAVVEDKRATLTPAGVDALEEYRATRCVVEGCDRPRKHGDYCASKEHRPKCGAPLSRGAGGTCSRPVVPGTDRCERHPHEIPLRGLTLEQARRRVAERHGLDPAVPLWP